MFPFPLLLSFIGGYLIGSAGDDNDDSWKTFIQKKNGGDVDVPKYETEYKWMKKDRNFTEIPYYKIKKR